MYRAPPPTPAVHLEARLTADDYIDAQRLNLRPGKRLRIFLYCVLPPIGLGSAFILYDWIRGAPLIKHDSLIGLLVPFITFVVLLRWYVLLPSYTRRVFKQQKTLHDKIVFDFNTEGMRAEALHGASHVPWSHFHKWKANGRVLVLFQSDLLMNLVPLRALSDSASREALLALVENGVGPQA
jgi:hypothetical protein